MIVLLSSGLDSTVNLYEATSRGKVKLAITFDYGQKAAKKEIENSAHTSRHLNIPHKVIVLPWLKEITQSALVNNQAEIPLNMDIDDAQETQESAKRVWVPNRNGVFLSIAASFAEALDAKVIVPGFNFEEAQTFPDNSEEFIRVFTEGLLLSTLSQVRVECFTTHMNKSEILKRAKSLGVRLEFVWPCYFANEAPCGECESCLRFLRAVREG